MFIHSNAVFKLILIFKLILDFRIVFYFYFLVPILFQVWSSPLADGSIAVLLANKGPKESRMTVTWGMLGLNDHLVYHARDLWKHADLKIPVQGNLTALVRSHGVAMFKLTLAVLGAGESSVSSTATGVNL